MSAEGVIVAEIQDLVDEVSAWFVGWMGFAGKYDLDRSPSIVEQLLEPLQVTEEQGCAFVGRKPSGKSSRVGFRV